MLANQNMTVNQKIHIYNSTAGSKHAFAERENKKEKKMLCWLSCSRQLSRQASKQAGSTRPSKVDG